jgi:SAM-dependent methyltransferase
MLTEKENLMAQGLNDCPFCHHQNAVVYRPAQQLRSGGSADVYQCQECRGLYPRPRLSEAQSLHWLLNVNPVQKDAALLDPTIVLRKNTGLTGAVKSFLQPQGTLFNLAGFLRKKIKCAGNALDIGAWSGEFCFVLGALGFKAYGLEPQEKVAQFARQKGLNVFAGSFPNNIPREIESIRFDFISVLEAVYYFTDLKKSLDKLASLLNDGGYLLLKCHQGKSRYYRNSDVSLFQRFGDNVQAIPTVDSLRHCLTKCGFEIVEAKAALTFAAAPFNYDFPGQKRGPVQQGIIYLEMVLNKFYEKIILNLDAADQIIVLARKTGENHV